MPWTPIVGKRWTASEFETYVKATKVPNGPFQPRAITLHHTWRPTLDQWKRNEWRENLASLERFYSGKGWHSGPHLYIDDEYVYGFTPLWVRGVHAISFNHDSWGIEMVGDFGGVPDQGAPIPVKQKDLVIDAMVCLFKKLGVEPTEKSLHFHRDDPQAHKTCPGLLVAKAEILNLVRERLDSTVRPVVIDDREHIASLLADGRTYVEIRPFMDAIGGQVLFEKGQLAVVRKGARMFFAPGTYKTVGGHSYLPLEELAKKLKLTVTVNKERTDVRSGG